MRRAYDFSNVKIKDALAKRIDAFVGSDRGKQNGFRSRADFVTKAALKLLEDVTRFEHMDLVDDRVKVIDYSLRRVATISFKPNGLAHCEVCDTQDCAHITYALAQPDIKR